MKNCLYIFVLAASLLLSSCSKEVGGGGQKAPDGNDEPVAIDFGMKAKEETKGRPVDGSIMPNGANVGVFASLLPSPDGGISAGSSSVWGESYGSKFTNNTSVTYNSGVCSYSPKRYWPDERNDRLKFFAYYPRSGTGLSYTVPADGPDPYLKLTYRPAESPLSHIDLMYAVTGDLSHQAVNLEFNHALTRLTFSAQLQYSETQAKVKINSIRMVGLIKKGDLCVQEYPARWDLTPYATTDYGDYNLSIAAGTLKDIELIEVPGDSSVNKDQDILPANGDIMVIPQSTETMVFEVDLAVTKTMYGESGPYEETRIETNYFISQKDTVEWLPGRHIHYRLTVARDVITLGARIVRWEDGGSTEVHLE